MAGRQRQPIPDEASRIRDALAQSGHPQKAAALLGISVPTFYARCREHGIRIQWRAVPVEPAETSAR